MPTNDIEMVRTEPTSEDSIVFCDATENPSDKSTVNDKNTTETTENTEQQKVAQNTNDNDKKKRRSEPLKKDEARVKREEEKRKRDEEKERQRLEKLEEQKKREEEKRKRDEEKERQRLERLEETKRREEERKRKEEEKEKQRIEREEEKRKKDEEREKQRLEKLEKERLKQESINARNEEKKRKEEEKQMRENKIKQQFFSYFIKKDSNQSQNTNKEDDENIKNSWFLPFQCKENMYLAPIHRRYNFKEEKDEIIKNFNELFSKQDCDVNYLIELKKGLHIPSKYPNTIDIHAKEKDVFLIDEITKYKAKFLFFDPKTYRRPAYYGTWTKNSKFINGRRPFAKDKEIFDYEVDSDEEWEDEADGESIDKSSDDEDEDGVNEEDDDDDGFFVPHGHLSDDEIDEENRIEPEAKNALEEAKREQWETDRKLQLKQHIILKYIGCIWDEKCEEFKILAKYQMVALYPLPIQLVNTIQNEKTDEDSNNKIKAKSQPNTDTENLTPSSKQKPKLKQIQQQASQQSPQQTSPSSASSNTILRFVSKLKNKTETVPIIAVQLNPTNSQQQQQNGSEKRANSDNADEKSITVKRLKLDPINNAVQNENKENNDDIIVVE